MTNTVGDKIRTLREVRGFSAKYMASELDLSLSGYNKIESGKTDISLNRLSKIAEILKTDVQSILSFDKSYVFHFNNNKNANGIVQNQYVTNSEDVLEVLSAIKRQIEIIEKVVTKP